jgi:hypothetical protein
MAMGNIQSISKKRSSKASRSLNIPKQRGIKASRSLTPVPEELGKLLRLVNIVPPDVELPDIAEMLKGVSPLFEEAELLVLIGKICKTLPDLVSIYIWLGEEKLFSIFDGTANFSARELLDKHRPFEKRYDAEAFVSENTRGHLAGVKYTYLREAREMLRDIIRRRELSPYFLKPLPNTRLSVSIGLITIGKDGLVKYSPPRFVKAIEGVEAARIRVCEVCKLLFWAGRLDQKACTTKCARVLRTRRWREKYQESYKLQRTGEKPLTEKEKKKLTDKRRNTKKGK